MKASRSSPDPPFGRALRQHPHAACVSGDVGAHLHLDRVRDVAQVDAGRSSRTTAPRMPCSSIVTRPCPWSRIRPTKTAPSRKSASAALCWAAVGPRQRRGAEAGRVLDALDQEAVAVPGVRELVDQPALRRSPPGLHVLPVVAERGRGGVQIEVLTGRRAADPRSQQQRRRLERARRHDHPRGAHRHARRGSAAGAVAPQRLDARRPPSSTSTRSANAPTMIRAPCSTASSR